MSDPIVILFAVRHGATTANNKGLFRGNINPPLAPDGIRDAHKIAAYFKDQPLSFIVSSDRVRATHTAQIIKDGHNVPLEETSVLRALNIGKYSGQPRDKKNTAEVQTLSCATLIKKFPCGESLDDFRARIQPAFWEAFSIADDSGIPGMIVAHSSIIHEIGNIVMGDHEALLVEPGGVATDSENQDIVLSVRRVLFHAYRETEKYRKRPRKSTQVYPRPKKKREAGTGVAKNLLIVLIYHPRNVEKETYFSSDFITIGTTTKSSVSRQSVEIVHKGKNSVGCAIFKGLEVKPGDPAAKTIS